MSSRIIAKLKTPRIKSISLHPSNKTVALTLYNGTFILYSTTDYKPTHTARVSDLPLRCSAYLNNILCIGCDDTQVYFYENDKKIYSFQAHKDFIRRIETINNFILTCSDDTTIKLWKYENGQVSLVSIFEGHSHFVMDIQIVSIEDNNFTFVSSSLDGTVRLWSTKQKNCLYVLSGHTDGVNSATPLQPVTNTTKQSSSSIIVSCSDDLSVKIWDNQKCVYTIRGHTKNVNRVRFFNNFFCTLSEDGYIKIYNTKTYKLEMNQNLQMERVWDCIYVNNNLFIVCDEGMTVIEYGKSSFNICMNQNKIIYNENESLKLVKTKNINFVRELQFLEFSPTKIKISNDGKLISVCNGSMIIIYSILGMRIRKQIEGDNLIFIEGGCVIKQKNTIQVQCDTNTEQSKDMSMKSKNDDFATINTIQNVKNLIGAKDSSVYAINTTDNLTNIFYKTFPIFTSQNCKNVIFYESYAIFLGDNILIIKFDYEMVCDYVEQGIEPEDHYKLVYKGNRKVDDYFVSDDVLYFSSNSKLFYIILNVTNNESDEQQTCYFIDIYYGSFNGKFVGVYENEIYIFDGKIIKKEVDTKFMEWQRNVLSCKIAMQNESEQECLNNYLTNYNYTEEVTNSYVDFLISLECYKEALLICNDNNKKFELLMKMKNYKNAFLLANNNSKLKALMKEFVKLNNFELAGECALKSKDYENLFLINAFTNKFDNELQNCGQKNIEFFSAYQNGNFEKCKAILNGSVFEDLFSKNYVQNNGKI